nr:carbohydrate-binding protein [Enterococcus sp. DIV0869a]
MICGVSLSIVSLNEKSYAETNVLEGRAIIGEDTRVRVMDTTKAPYSSIIYLLKADGGFGSGTVIGKNKVLTAAHVVTSLKTSADISKASVTPARNGYYYPFGSFSIESIDMHTGWTVENNRDHDIAVVTLKPNSSGKNIGDVVPIISVNNVPNLPRGTKGLLPGYSQDKHGQLWEARGSVISQTESRVYYDMDSIGGTSGAPVYDENNQLIAVHTSEYRMGNVAYKNGGSKITGSNYEFIAKHLEQKEIDTQAPNQVTGVKASNITSTSAQLNWNASTDNVGVEKYEVYRNGSRIGESRTTSFELSGLTANTSYTISIAALDKAGNRSFLSTALIFYTEKEVEKPSENQTTWVQEKIYVAGDKVFYDGIEYRAKWWTKGNKPGMSDVWEKLSTGTIEEWKSELAYSGGNVITFKGVQYKAKWWNRGEEPGKSPVWEKM